MKKLLLPVFFLFFTYCAFCQEDPKKLPVDSSSNKITYKAMVDVPGMAKDDIYKKSREWFATTFKSANSVLQMDDKESGKLIGKGNFMFNYIINAGFGATSNMPETVGFTLNISIKDNKYRIVITDFTVTTTTKTLDFENQYQAISIMKSYYGKNKAMTSTYNNMISLISDTDNSAIKTLESFKSAIVSTKKDDF